MTVVEAEAGMDEANVEFVFSVQESCVSTIWGKIEEQLMRSRLKQALRANIVADNTEAKVTELYGKVVVALNT